MIDGLKSYPKYNDSGLPWLGKVPEHWTVLRGKHLFRCIDIRSSTGQEELLTVSSERGVVPRASAKVTMFKAESYVGYKLCWPGDLAINSLWAWGGGLGVSRHHGIISSAYGVYRLREPYQNYASYYHELVRSVPFNWELRIRSKGIWISRLQLTDEAFLDAPFPVPPIADQAAIVRFLDHADRRIRRYIKAKRRLIALLNEQKQAIIHRAVTRGLDPNVRLKPSGIEWLGDVPEHWTVHRLKTLLWKIDQGISPQAEARLADDGWWGVLKSGCVNRGSFRETEHKRLPNGYEFDEELAVQPGDVLVSRACGSPSLVGSVGRVGQLKYRLVLSDKTFRLNFKEPQHVAFLVAAMQTRYYRSQVEQAISGAEGLANNLPLSSLRNFRFAVPPPDEAEQIATSLIQQTNSFVVALAETEREIDLLLELRTRLIADVVTGKLDVREAAARLPDEFAEQETLGDADVLTEGDEVIDDADLDAIPEEAEA